MNGDYNEMRSCLALLAPSGKYGTLSIERKDRPESLNVDKGSTTPRTITLLVDRTTSGAAEILALALSSKGKAKLTGSEMGPDRSVRQIVELPDGSGYTLVTGIYKPELEKDTVVAQGGRS